MDVEVAGRYEEVQKGGRSAENWTLKQREGTMNFHESVRKASTFIKKCILKAIEMDIPLTDGVPFEELLTTLK